MTYYLIAKWFFIALIIIYPIGLYWLWEEINLRRDRVRTTDIFRRLITITSWIAGLVCAQIALSFHKAHWMAKYAHLPLTEELLATMGDSPNVSIGWVITGWMPIVAISITMRLIYRKKTFKESLKQFNRSKK